MVKNGNFFTVTLINESDEIELEVVHPNNNSVIKYYLTPLHAMKLSTELSAYALKILGDNLPKGEIPNQG